MQTQQPDAQASAKPAQAQSGTRSRSRNYARRRKPQNDPNLVYRVKTGQNAPGSPIAQQHGAAVPPQPAVANVNSNDNQTPQQTELGAAKPRRRQRKPKSQRAAQQNQQALQDQQIPPNQVAQGGQPHQGAPTQVHNAQQTPAGQETAGAEPPKRGGRGPRRPRGQRQPRTQVQQDLPNPQANQGQNQGQANQSRASDAQANRNADASTDARQGPARRNRSFRQRMDTRYGNCSEEVGPRRRQGQAAANNEGEAKQEAPSAVEQTKDPERPIEKESEFFYEAGKNCFGIRKGFVPNMNVDGQIFVNHNLRQLLMEELKVNTVGGFLPAVKQVANVASLPGILQYSMGMPDIHCGYGFAIGNVAAFDMGNADAVVSPGGVGFDINCGVRLVRTNLMEHEVAPHKEDLAQLLFERIPVGVGAGGSVKITQDDLKEILNTGVDWAIKHSIAWPEDKEFCEENGHMISADASKVSARALKRGMGELGSLGAGNHYCEVQVVDEIFDQEGANALGLGKVGQVCAMVHCGSRGLGHQIATDFLSKMEKIQHEQKIQLNDRQLACARINSEPGQDYLKAMACAANFAWVNRQGIMHQIRESFEKVFNKSARDMDMQLVYDVSHNTAKVEDHVVNGEPKQLLVHRKGATRAFPPNHKLIPKAYSSVGQPVFIGGSMGTNSYVLLGTQQGMEKSFGSTCHGAGRCLSRHKSRTTVSSKEVMDRLASQGIAIRIQTPKLVMEEAPETYKDVNEVVRTCDEVGLSKICVKLRPLAVIKG